MAPPEGQGDSRVRATTQGWTMTPKVDLGNLLVVLSYAQKVQDDLAVQLETALTDEARELLVQIELVAPLN